MKNTFTLSDFLNKYKSNDDCLEAIKNIRYPDGITCRECKKVTPHYKRKGKKAYSCQFCGTLVSPLAGTIFHKSSTPLLDWFYAIYLITQTRSGTSAKQLERMLGVTYKTAWRMFHQVRKLMADTEGGLLDGTVEIDETFVGGKSNNRKNVADFGEKPKEVVMGMVKRNGKARLKHIESTGKYALLEQIEQNVSPKARIITDEYSGYWQLKKLGYNHYSVNHKRQFVEGDIYTQNAENVWSHLKRGIYGVYRHVSKKHLQAYVDEFEFRYNNRKSTDMFSLVLNRIATVQK